MRERHLGPEGPRRRVVPEGLLASPEPVAGLGQGIVDPDVARVRAHGPLQERDLPLGVAGPTQPAGQEQRRRGR